jgi:hypothetical protein
VAAQKNLSTVLAGLDAAQRVVTCCSSVACKHTEPYCVHAAASNTQVGGGRGYEVDEEFEEWEDNLPFKLERLQQHPQLMDHLIKQHQAAHERDLALYDAAPVQPRNSSGAGWLRKHDTTRSVVAWMGAGLGSLQSSSSGDEDDGYYCTLEDAALFAEAPVWETGMDCMTKELADVAAAVLQAQGRYDVGRAVWPPAIYDHKDSGCCRQSSTAEEAVAEPQAPAGRTAVTWQSPVAQQQQQQQQRVPARAMQVLAATAAAATTVPVPAAAATGAACGTGAGAAAPAVAASKKSTRQSPRPASPAAEYQSSSRHSSSTGSPAKLPAALPSPKHLQVPSGLQGSKQASSSSSSSNSLLLSNAAGSSSNSAGSASKLMSHHKRNMSAIQEEDESAGLAAAAAAARYAKQQQHGGLCEIEAADSDDEGHHVDCSAASDASLHFEHGVLA